ncbi:MAG TPA: hypothetical protein VNN72_24685 [Polyangiaceae bacterium]|nr:hypothetical protein [Polyangiaceae bacterium]
MPSQVRQQALTAMLPVRSGEAAALDAWLVVEAPAITRRLAHVTSLHFGRFVLLPGAEPLVALETSFDGELEAHLDELWAAAGASLEPLLERCTGWTGPGDPGAFGRYVRAHLREASAFFAAHPGLTVGRVQADARLRRELGRYLDRQRALLEPLASREIVQRAQAALRGMEPEARLELVPVERAVTGEPKSVLRILLEHVLSLVGTVLLAVIYDLSDLLRRLWTDAEPSTPSPELVARAGREEAGRLVNALTHVAELKPGSFRRGALRLALRITDELARAASFSGRLGGIESIHFARWVLLPDGRLVFFSNYDGSWESYLGEFIERASRGLTMIWSNTVGFPTTFAWVLGGARDEAGFKRWTRARQLPTPLWYSAYPELSVAEVRRNAEIREILARDIDEAGARRVLEVVRD